MRKILIGVLTVAAASACNPDAPESPVPTSTVISTSPSPTPTARPTTTLPPIQSPSPSPTPLETFPPAPPSETDEEAAVRAAWEAYYAEFYRFAGEHSLTDFTSLIELTTGVETEEVRDNLRIMRDDHQRLVGGISFRDVKVSYPNPREVNDANSALVSYCVDRSEMYVEDTRTGAEYEQDLVNLEEEATLGRGDDGVWRVALIRNRRATC